MFGRDPTIKIPKSLYERLEQAAKRDGYDDVRELVVHCLSENFPDQPNQQAQQETRKRLRGLGYIE